MAVRRAKRPDDSFVIVSKAITENRCLSWEARAVHVYVLGKPNDWVIRLGDLISQTEDCGRKHTRRDGMREIIRELVALGYWTVAQDRGGEGTFAAVEYVAHDHAQPLTDNPVAVAGRNARESVGGVENPPHAPVTGNPPPAPLTALPVTAEPVTANPPLLKNDLLPRNEKVATNEVASGRRNPFDLGSDLLEPTHALVEIQPSEAPAVRQRHPAGVKPGRMRQPTFMPPAWVPAEAWAGWIEMRDRKKVPNTDRALRSAVKILDELTAKGWDPERVIDLATTNGWKSFYEPRDQSMRADTAKVVPIRAEQSQRGNAALWAAHENHQEQSGTAAAPRPSITIAGAKVTGPAGVLARVQETAK